MPVSLQFKVRLGFGEVRLVLFRVGSELLCFIESWLIVFSEGLARRSIYDWLKTLLMVAGWLACLLAGSLASFLACFLNCLLAAFLACLPACKVVACSGLPAWLACLLASWLACLLAPLACCLHACLLDCWLAGLAGWLAAWPACLLACLLGCLLPCSVAQLLACLLPCLACLLACWFAFLLGLPGLLACLPAGFIVKWWSGKKIPGEGKKYTGKNSAPFQGANRSHPDRAETPTDPVI